MNDAILVAGAQPIQNIQPKIHNVPHTEIRVSDIVIKGGQIFHQNKNVIPFWCIGNKNVVLIISDDMLYTLFGQVVQNLDL